MRIFIIQYMNTGFISPLGRLLRSFIALSAFRNAMIKLIIYHQPQVTV